MEKGSRKCLAVRANQDIFGSFGVNLKDFPLKISGSGFRPKVPSWISKIICLVQLTASLNTLTFGTGIGV